VQSEVARIEQLPAAASSASSASSSASASAPVAKPSPMKVAAKPATGFSLDAYKKREAANRAYQQSLKK
jgi:hypothetical protein